MNNIKWFRIILIILLLPLFFINVKSTHDWGDDFAQYLIQARNIVEHRNQSDNGLILKENDPVFAVVAYPVGFPLIIAPIYYFFQLQVLPYNYLQTILLLITGLLIFEFFRNRTDVFTSILITLLFCYNFNIIDLKKQILSEISFTLFIMLFLLWMDRYYNKIKYSSFIAGIILCVLISIRLAGIAILVGFVIYQIKEIIINKNSSFRKKLFQNLFITLSASILLFIFINGLIFNISIPGLFGFYSNAYQTNNSLFGSNITFYYRVSEYVFTLFGSWLSPVWLVIALTGSLIHLIKKQTLLDYCLPVYIILILFYPYANAGVRFILPALPLLIYYTGYFFNWLLPLNSRFSKWIPACVFIFVLLSYPRPLKAIIESNDSIEDGPQLPAAEELFSYLKSLKNNEPVLFCKARAMALYSGHATLYFAKEQTNKEAFNQFQDYKNLLIVLSKSQPGNEIYDHRLMDFISLYKSSYQLIWENNGFLIYRQNITGN